MAAVRADLAATYKVEPQPPVMAAAVGVRPQQPVAAVVRVGIRIRT
jgi:hypothetical protein